MIGRWRAGSPWFEENGDPTDRGGAVSEVTETQLPGVGVRHEFVTAGGERVAVLSHRTGRREIAVYDRADPDACTTVLHLTPTTPAPWPSSSVPARSAKRWRPCSNASKASPSTGSRSRRVPARRRDDRRGRVPDPDRRLDRRRRSGRGTTSRRPGPTPLRGRRRRRRRRHARRAGPAARPAGGVTVLAAAGGRGGDGVHRDRRAWPSSSPSWPGWPAGSGSRRSPSTCWPGWRSARAASPPSTSAPTSSVSSPRSGSCCCC